MQSTTKHRPRGLSTVVAAALAFALPTPMPARSGTGAGAILPEQLDPALQPGPQRLPATGDVECAFSPKQGAERPVLKVIASAPQELRLLAYSFTSAPVTAALIAARERGVDVRILVDQRSNFGDDRSGKARATLGALSLAGIRGRSIGAYPIHHDKVIVAERSTVQTGSINYPAAAANANSENVLLLCGRPQLAQAYLAHRERKWRQGSAWQPAC